MEKMWESVLIYVQSLEFLNICNICILSKCALFYSLYFLEVVCLHDLNGLQFYDINIGSESDCNSSICFLICYRMRCFLLRMVSSWTEEQLIKLILIQGQIFPVNNPILVELGVDLSQKICTQVTSQQYKFDVLNNWLLGIA